MMLYVIAGHGAGDPGACAGGCSEADLVRQLAARMKELGGDGVHVLDTSRDWYRDGGVSYLKPVVEGNPVIELHMDSGSASARGGHVIIKDGYAPDANDNALAAFISSMFPGRSNTIVGRSNLANINRAAKQGINYRLLETCFISNDGDRARFINQMDDVARGILAAFGMEGENDMQLNEIVKRPDGHEGTVNDVLAYTDMRVEAIEQMLNRTDDPTGRGKNMTTHEHIKWMAAKQADMEEKLDKVLELLAEKL